MPGTLGDKCIVKRTLLLPVKMLSFSFLWHLEGRRHCRMKLNISFPATGCRKLIEVDDECKFLTFYESIWPQKLLLMLWVKNGRMMWFKSVEERRTDKVSPGDRVSWPMAVCACCWLSKGHSCCRTRRTGERKHKSVGGYIVDANLSVLNLVTVKKREQDIPDTTDHWYYYALSAWGPKELEESANFSVSLKKIMSNNMLWKSP